MLFELYILFLTISFIFMFFGFYLDDTAFKVLGFGIFAYIHILNTISGLSYPIGDLVTINGTSQIITKQYAIYHLRTLNIILTTFGVFGAFIFSYIEHKNWSEVD